MCGIRNPSRDEAHHVHQGTLICVIDQEKADMCVRPGTSGVFLKGQILVIYDTFIKGHDFEEVHTHMKRLIPRFLIKSLPLLPMVLCERCVWSPDTDVLLLLLDLVSCEYISAPTTLKFLTGKGTTRREIDIFERVKVINVTNVKDSLAYTIFLELTGEEKLWESQKRHGSMPT